MTMINKLRTTGITFWMALLASGSALAHGPTAASVVEKRTDNAVVLAPGGGVLTTVLQHNVPAGTWIVTAKASVVSWGDADYLRCGILENGTIVDASTTMIGEAGGMPAVATIASQKVLNRLTASTVSLVCLHDFNTDEPPYVDPGASIIISP